MMPPPATIDGAVVVCWASTTSIEKTDACVFRRAGEVQTSFAGLAIAQYPGENACYLFLCDELWKTLNDLFHENIDDAKAMGERLYPGIAWR